MVRLGRQAWLWRNLRDLFDSDVRPTLRQIRRHLCFVSNAIGRSLKNAGYHLKSGRAFCFLVPTLDVCGSLNRCSIDETTCQRLLRIFVFGGRKQSSIPLDMPSPFALYRSTIKGTCMAETHKFLFSEIYLQEFFLTQAVIQLHALHRTKATFAFIRSKLVERRITDPRPP